jgi:Zn-finger nucleic acid-binding protein
VPLSTHTITTDGEGWEVEVDVCKTSCGGLWLEAHDFEADPSAKLLMDSELLTLNRTPVRPINTKAPADCPACHVAMHRFDWNNEGIHLDTCPMCKGRWIDGGEVRTIHKQWDVEPVSEARIGEVMREVAKVKQQTNETWQEDSFGQWLMKRLMFTSTRDKK